MLQEKRIEQINYVVNNSKHVKINHKRLDTFASVIKGITIHEHPWKKYKSIFTEKEIIILAFIIESMNFCFWKEPVFNI